MSEGTMTGEAVYVQTNERENQIVAFVRAADGVLAERGRYSTDGAGDGKPHLTSQGSVVLSGDERHLLVANVGSDEVSVIRVGGAEPELIQTLSSGGAAPKSLAEREGIVYALSLPPRLSSFASPPASSTRSTLLSCSESGILTSSRLSLSRCGA